MKVTILVGIAVLGATAAVSGGVAAADSPQTEAAPRHEFHWSAASEWRGSGGASSPEELREAGQIANGLNDQLQSVSESHRFATGDGQAIAVVSTKRGGVCASAHDGDQLMTAFCSPDLNPNGTMIVSMREPNAASTLAGVVAEDVTSFTATLNDGSTVEVPYQDGTVLWTPADGAVVDEFTTTREGSDQVYRQVFVQKP